MILRFLKIALIFLLLSLNSFAQQWYLSPVYHSRNIYDVEILDRASILAGGGNEQNDSLQEIFISYSGGMDWNFANNQGGGYIRSMDFIDAQNGLAVGYAGKILKTENGSASWEQVYGLAPISQRNFTTVHYKDAQTVLAFGGRSYGNDTIQTIIKSTDGGSTWNAIRDQAGRWLKGAFFKDNNNGFAVGGAGTIIKTTDGGNNWTNVTSPLNTRDFNAVYFSSPSTGYIVGGNFVMFDTLASMRTILKTIDGGANWNVIMDEPGGSLTALDFIDQNNGYLTGDGAQFYTTTNGGSNWIRQTVQGSQYYSNFTSVKFLNQDFGVVGGMYGEVFLYSNEPLPEVITTVASVTQVTDTNASVILRANINTHNSPVTYNFFYSTVSDFSSDVDFAYIPSWAPAFNSSSLSPVEFSGNNFLPNTTYYYYITARSPRGTAYGDTLSFTTTIPYSTLQTNQPISNNDYTVFSGIINQATTPFNLYFEYGTSTLFGNEVQATPFLVNDNQSYSLYDNITTLLPNTVYYYRVKGISLSETYYGNTVSFYSGSLFDSFDTQEATDITQTSATINGFVDNFRLPLTNIHFAYGTSPWEMNTTVAANPSSINDTLSHNLSVSLTSLQPESYYYFRLQGQSAFGFHSSSTQTFYTGDLYDTFTALPPTNVSETSAQLNGFAEGFINPIQVSFEYGPTPSLGYVMQANPGFINDNGAYSLVTDVNYLSPSTLYYYRLVANISGNLIYSNTVSFITGLPSSELSASAATNVTESSAQLNGWVNRLPFSASFSFEYGLTETVGSEVAATPGSISDTLYHTISANVIGLLADTVYYFRIKANANGQDFTSTMRKVYTGVPQVPNWNFENWDIDTLLLPEQWNIANDENFERVAGYSGSYALKISKVNFAILGFPGDGEGNNDGPAFYGGCAFGSRPDSVGFYMNYNINPLDSGIFISHLYSGDSIISSGIRFISGNSGGNFQHFSFPLEYNSTLTPDSIVLGFASFNPFSSVVNDPANNFMIIDEISFSPAATHSCNIDFEDWFEFVFDAPQDWYYFKTLAIDPDNIEESRMVKKVQGINADEYAVQIQNVNISGYIFNASFATIKGKDFFGPTTSGTPVNRRYSRLNGYYKYSCSEQDTVVIALAMFKNGTNVGYGTSEASGALDDFQILDIPISYFDEVTIPDSVVIDVKTNNYGSATDHATVTIDRLSFDGIWGEVVTDTTGVENRIAPDDLKIYPNPTKNTFVAELSDSNFKVGVGSVIDINGRVLSQIVFSAGQSRISFDVSDFDAGIYFVKIATDDKVFNKKIIVLK